MLELRDVRVAYRLKEVVKGVSVTFSGKHVVLGPNGHGKTTLFKAVSGLVPYKGEILIEGVPLSKLEGGAGLLAVNLPEVYRLVPVTAWEVAQLYSDIMGVDLDLAAQTLSEFGIATAELKRKKMWELSAGMLKAFCTVLSLSSGAKNVLLDEPFEQLDPAKKGYLAKLLKSYGGAIVLNTHETWVLNQLPDWQVHVMVDGKLYGPAAASKLASARIVSGPARRPILVVPVGSAILSFVEEEVGEPVSNILTLDRLYDVVLRGG